LGDERISVMSGRARATWWYLGIGAAVVAAGPMLPAAARQAVYVCCGLSVIAAILLGLRRYRPEWSRPWWLLIGSVGAGMIASLWWAVDLSIFGERLFPSGGDVVYSLVIPLLILAMLGWIRPGQPRGGRVEAGIVAAGGAALMWALVVEPMFHDRTISTLQLGWYLTYLAGDLVVLVLAAHMLLITQVRTMAYALLIGGAGLLIATDVTYYAILANTGAPPTFTAAGYVSVYLLVGAAALHPSMAHSGGQVASEPNPTSQARLWVYVALIATAVALTGLQIVRAGKNSGDEWMHVLVPLGLAGLMAMLLVVRLSQLAVLLDKRSRLDDLTGLGNLVQLRAELDTVRPGSALLLIDLDGFRDVNDSYGHDVGDGILREVGRRLAVTAGRLDASLMRVGSDEFAVLLRGGAAFAVEFGQWVVDAVRAPYPVPGGGTALLTASVGVLPLDRPTSAAHALREGDLALFTGQRNGGNQVAVYDAAAHTERQARTRMVHDVDRALHHGEFEVHYQPIADLGNGAIVAAEALLRWTTADGTKVSPADFIPVAEQSGAIVPIGTWVIEQVCAQLREWYPRYGLSVTVNAAARQLRREDFADTVLGALDRNNLPGAALIVEITETGLITATRDAATVTAQLQRLRDRGVRIAIDDFGTGYSSLAYLRQLPVDILKMDGSFTLHHDGDRDHVFVRAIVELAGSLGLRTIAEAVETPEQAERLRLLGCDLAQGYHFARPGPPAAMEAVLNASQRPAPNRSPANGGGASQSRDDSRLARTARLARRVTAM
jgi:diguanylate cyclase (GGDEF)-like protein